MKLSTAASVQNGVEPSPLFLSSHSVGDLTYLAASEDLEVERS